MTRAENWKRVMKPIVAAACLLAAIHPLTPKTGFALPVAASTIHGSKVADQPPSRASVREAKAAVISFSRDLVPLFRDNCTMSHQGDVPMAALALTPGEAYANLVGIPSMQSDMLRVAPGKPERSYLYYKTAGKNALVKGGGIGMPWASALSPAELRLLSDWIKQGARNN